MRYHDSTSEAAAALCFTQLKDKYGYTSIEEAFADRHNHRVEWAEIIWSYNQPDGLTLYRDMLRENDILNGIRRGSELQALKDNLMIDLIVWIDRAVPDDPSCEIKPMDADIMIPNYGTFDELYQKLARFARVCKVLR